MCSCPPQYSSTRTISGCLTHVEHPARHLRARRFYCSWCYAMMASEAIGAKAAVSCSMSFYCISQLVHVLEVLRGVLHPEAHINRFQKKKKKKKYLAFVLFFFFTSFAFLHLLWILLDSYWLPIHWFCGHLTVSNK